MEEYIKIEIDGQLEETRDFCYMQKSDGTTDKDRIHYFEDDFEGVYKRNLEGIFVFLEEY